MERDHDWLRQLMLSDPRGSVNCAVNLLTPPIREDADIGMIVMEPDFYVPMSGGNLICTVTVALETGFIPMQEPQTIVRVDTPAGAGRSRLRLLGRPVPPRHLPQRRVLRHAPRRHRRGGGDRDDPGRRRLWRDDLLHRRCRGSRLHPRPQRGPRPRRASASGSRRRPPSSSPRSIPENPGIHTINQTLFAGPLRTENGVKRSKNTVVVSPGRLDRCPCGTGTSARLALLHARGELATGRDPRPESILDTEFHSRVVETTQAGPVAAVVPEVSGPGLADRSRRSMASIRTIRFPWAIA